MKNYEMLMLKLTNNGKIPVWIDILGLAVCAIRVILSGCKPGVQRQQVKPTKGQSPTSNLHHSFRDGEHLQLNLEEQQLGFSR